MRNRILPDLAHGDGACDGPPVRGPRSEWKRAKGVFFASVSHFPAGGIMYALDIAFCRRAAWDGHREGHRDRFELPAGVPWQVHRVGPFVLAFLIRPAVSRWDRELLARQARGGGR